MPSDGPGGSVPASERRSANRILPQIDGLRGVAILAVLYQHAFSHGVGAALATLGVIPYLQGNGWLGVSLFFILSGFVLALPFIGKESKLSDPGDALAFYRRRAKRLLPLFAIGCFVGYLVNHTSPGSLFLALTTLSMFDPSEFMPRVNGPFWTLVLEIWFSILTPILLILALRFGYWRVLVAAVAVALATRIVATQFAFPRMTIDPVKDSVPARIDDFVIGIVIAKLYVDGRLRDAPRWILPCGVALVVASALGWDLVRQGIVPMAVRAFLNLPTSVGFACIVISCLHEGSGITRLVTAWPLRVAGAMSYSLYCWHYWIMHATDPNSLSPRRIGLFLVVTLAVSLLSYKFIEFPQKPWRLLLRLGDQTTHSVVPGFRWWQRYRASHDRGHSVSSLNNQWRSDP
jgi:peptidoglycan/LPS O-acetylase OafA/YrhL